jgi:hypothetical protein
MSLFQFPSSHNAPTSINRNTLAYPNPSKTAPQLPDRQPHSITANNIKCRSRTEQQRLPGPQSHNHLEEVVWNVAGVIRSQARTRNVTFDASEPRGRREAMDQCHVAEV